MLDRRDFDAWFPTIVRYFGILIIFWEITFDNFQHFGEVAVAATSLIVFKNVVGSNGKGGDR